MNLFDVAGKVVLVTGGSKGIGALLVRGFHAAGATVIISSRKVADCDALAAELGQGAIAIAADVSTQEGCQQLAAAVESQVGRLDVLINNAGATWGAPLEEYPDEGWDKVLALNLKSPFHLAVASLGLLRQAATAEDPARIINIGSVDGVAIPAWESYAYSASKAGVHHLTRHLASRLAGENITVNAIAPGVVESQMTAFLFEDGEDEFAARTPLQRTGRLEDMAGAAIFLASPAAAWITGVVLPVDGGYATLR